MFSRIALFAGSLAAALVLAAGLAYIGLAPATTAPAGAQAQVEVVDTAAVTADTPQANEVQVDTVYLSPQATPAVTEVVKVVHKKAAAGTSSSGEGDEHEGGDDD